MINLFVPKSKGILYRLRRQTLFKNRSNLINNTIRYKEISYNSNFYFPFLYNYGIRTRRLYSTSTLSSNEQDDPFSSIRDDHGDEEKYSKLKQRNDKVFEEEDEEEDDFDHNEKEDSVFYISYDLIEPFRRKLLDVEDTDKYVIQMKSLVEQEKHDEVISLFNELKEKKLENPNHFSIVTYSRLATKRFFQSSADFKVYAQSKLSNNVMIELLDVMLIGNFSLFRRRKGFNIFLFAYTLPTIHERTFDIMFSFYSLEKNYDEVLRIWKYYKKNGFFDKEDLNKKIYLNYLPALIYDGFYKDVMKVLRKIQPFIDLNILSMFEGGISKFEPDQQNEIINFITSNNESLKNTQIYYNIRFEQCQNINEAKELLDEYKSKGFNLNFTTYRCLFLNPNISIDDLNSIDSIENYSVDEKRNLLVSITSPAYQKNIEKVRFISKQFEPYSKQTLYYLFNYYISIDDDETLQKLVDYALNLEEPLYKRSYSKLLNYYMNRNDLDNAFRIWSNASKHHRRVYINDCISLLKCFTKLDSIEHFTIILDHILESNGPHRWNRPLSSLIYDLDEKGEFKLIVHIYKTLKKHNLYSNDPNAYKRFIYATFRVSNTSDIIDIVEETLEVTKNPITVNVVVERFLKYLSMKTDKYNDYVKIILKLIEEKRGLDKLSISRLKYLFMMVRNDKSLP